jgi:succinylarginine dihydrolase
MTDVEQSKVNPNTFINDSSYNKLCAWVNKHYRDKLHVADLIDPQLLIESRTALDELTQILGYGSVYPFQR